MVVLVPTGRWLVERWETDVWSDVCTCCTAREAREWRYWLVERGCERVRIRRLGQNRHYRWLKDCGFEPRREWARTVLPSRTERSVSGWPAGGAWCSRGFAHDGVPLADRT